MQKGDMKNRNFKLISRSLSEMIQDMAVVTVEDEHELICSLSNVTTWNDHERHHDFLQHQI